MPPRHPGPSGPPSPTLPTPRSSPGSGWATLRQRTGLGGHPDPHRASLAQSGASPSRPGASASQSGAVQGFLQAAGGGLGGFGSNVSLPTLDERGTGALQQVSHLCDISGFTLPLFSHADVKQQVCCNCYCFCICTHSSSDRQAWPLLVVVFGYTQAQTFTAMHGSFSTLQIVIGSSRFANKTHNSVDHTGLHSFTSNSCTRDLAC